MKRYEPLKVEAKWQKIWLDEKPFAAKDNDTTRNKIYAAEMFPYPSGAAYILDMCETSRLLMCCRGFIANRALMY